jgi:hypothetical protein
VSSTANRWQTILTVYLWVVMAGLLLQGAGSLLMDSRPDIMARTPWLMATVMNGNPPHAYLHIVWGIAGLLWLAVFRTAGAYRLLGLVFGLFYTGLGFLGIAVHHPFGMRLEFPENTFHLSVGPLMLLLTWLAWRSRRPEAAPATV